VNPSDTACHLPFCYRKGRNFGKLRDNRYFTFMVGQGSACLCHDSGKLFSVLPSGVRPLREKDKLKSVLPQSVVISVSVPLVNSFSGFLIVLQFNYSYISLYQCPLNRGKINLPFCYRKGRSLEKASTTVPIISSGTTKYLIFITVIAYNQ